MDRAGHVDKRAAAHRYVERHEVAWELLFAGLAVAFVALGFVEPEDSAAFNTIVTAEWALTGVFAVEFIFRLWAAPRRTDHLRSHWIDLISLVPPVRWLRPFRLLRLLRLIRAFAGVSRAMVHVPRLASHRGLVWMVAAWLGVSVIASVALYIAEHGANAAFDQPFDALWWGVVTLSTVGYGDLYPTTPEGRVAAMALMILGIGLYSAITAAVTSYFISQGSRGDSLATELQRLTLLRDEGALSDDEFRHAKGAILRSLAPGGD